MKYSAVVFKASNDMSVAVCGLDLTCLQRGEALEKKTGQACGNCAMESSNDGDQAQCPFTTPQKKRKAPMPLTPEITLEKVPRKTCRRTSRRQFWGRVWELL